MPKIKVIGVSSYDFVDKSTKKNVKGISIHFNTPIDERNGSGVKGDKLSIADEYVDRVLKNPLDDLLNKFVEVQFNKYGSADSVEIVK